VITTFFFFSFLLYFFFLFPFFFFFWELTFGVISQTPLRVFLVGLLHGLLSPRLLCDVISLVPLTLFKVDNLYNFNPFVLFLSSPSGLKVLSGSVPVPPQKFILGRSQNPPLTPTKRFPTQCTLFSPFVLSPCGRQVICHPYEPFLSTGHFPALRPLLP